MAKKLAQVRNIIESSIDTASIAKKLVDMGFTLPSSKIIPTGIPGRDLMLSSKRFYVLEDTWIRDEYLSYHWNKSFDWSPENLEKKFPWQPAQDYVAGIYDKIHLTRQPSVFECCTLFDLSRYNPAIIEAAKILNLKIDDWYWTNDTCPSYSDYARIVYFSYGSVRYGSKVSSDYVRPVRSSQ